MRTIPYTLFAVALSAGCSGDAAKDTADTAPGTTGDSGDTQDTVEDVDPVQAAWDSLPELLPGAPNVDDDSGNEEPDIVDDRSEDDDYSRLVLPADLIDNIDGELSLRLEDSTEISPYLDDGDVRVWHDGDLLLQGESSEALSGLDGDVEILVEFGWFLSEATLIIEDASHSAEVRLLASPLILNHHLQPSEDTWMMDVSSWGGNGQMVNTYTDVLGDSFHTLREDWYAYDVWVQDEIQFATATAEDIRVDVVIDSIRDRGLDDFPELELLPLGMGIETWGETGSWATSQDAFGNLEVAPPHSADGVDYPFGRIYYGAQGSYAPTVDLTDFLTEQRVQDPIAIDSSWLCVGHVDEFMSFIPDPTAPRGFRLIMSDTALAFELIDEMDPSISLPRYQSGHGFSTIGSIANDSGLRALNEELQTLHIDPILEMFTEEMELQPEEIIHFPAVFEEVMGCGGTVAALIPGTINLIIGNQEGESLNVFWADPFFRSNDADLGSDVMIPHMEALMPPNYNMHWMDDWEVYHLGLGEVHCGTNVTRTPTEDWWESGMHLIDG